MPYARSVRVTPLPGPATQGCRDKIRLTVTHFLGGNYQKATRAAGAVRAIPDRLRGSGRNTGNQKPYAHVDPRQIRSDLD